MRTSCTSVSRSSFSIPTHLSAGLPAQTLQKTAAIAFSGNLLLKVQNDTLGGIRDTKKAARKSPYSLTKYTQ
jgi:hypothetical protein